MADSPQLTSDDLARVVAVALDLAREGRTAELAEFLDHGLPVDVADSQGNTPIMLASYRGRLETVRMLIARGADLNLRNARDQSPVAGALFKGEDDVVRLLVGAGADLDAGTPSARATAALFGRQHLLTPARSA